MEVRPNPTGDNSSISQQHLTSSSLKQPSASSNPIDSNAVAQRLQKELMSLMMSGDDLGVSAFPEGESIFTWIGTIEGGKGTAYEGLSYKLSLHFPMEYPFKPPLVKFETMCFHPNVDQYGNICLDILQITERWSTNSIFWVQSRKADFEKPSREQTSTPLKLEIIKGLTL
ncbi:probable ubiquitin-conjugating enzyme E2 C isoform X3 [Cucurbita maxima]|uniref:Probable ubiquitin-conjugating enzyme E2 C isoform X3 n=1 Tax=Cucurbita maxima TaxID=3661 RepID=A0A6J1HVK1_CUCMA|nr:probable ubiquitin-conjugating enzyme E2 C isoform X3 [Cucurbita maxima]